MTVNVNAVNVSVVRIIKRTITPHHPLIQIRREQEEMKAILVIDMPERCSMCEFIKKTDEVYCYCGRLGFDFSVNDYMKSTPIGKPDWCPLVEVPQKKDIRNANTMTDLGWIEGFNSFLDYILQRER